MPWFLQRFFYPLIVGSTACAALLVLFIVVTADTPVSLQLAEVGWILLVILPFEAMGLILLLPIGLLVCKQSLTLAFTVFAVLFIGAGIGIAIALPLSNAPMHQDLALPAVFGAVSAAIWLRINRELLGGKLLRP